MNQPEASAFDEPWQATAFAMVVKLHEGGLFTWPEWAETLGAELAANRDRGYYDNWLAALERLVTAKGVAGRAELGALKAAWHDAYVHTPHGKPVRLAADKAYISLSSLSGIFGAHLIDIDVDSTLKSCEKIT